MSTEPRDLSERADIVDRDADGGSVLTHEEQLQAGTRTVDAGTIRARKTVETRRFEDYVPRESEEADVDRVAAEDGDAGEIRELPDGSVSIPVLEEEIVITKRTRVKERIIIRKTTSVEQFKVEADLRVEHVDVEADDPELLATQTTHTRAGLDRDELLDDEVGLDREARIEDGTLRDPRVEDGTLREPRTI